MGAPRLVRLCFALDVLLVLAYLGDVFLLGKPSPLLTRLLDVNGEWNVPTFHSALQLLLAGTLVAEFASRSRHDGRGGHHALLLLPALLLLLGLDELLQIHEAIGMASDALLPSGTRKGTIFSRTGVWMLLLGPPLAAAAAYVSVRVGRLLPTSPPVRQRLAIGGAVFLGSAIGLELLSNVTKEPPAMFVQYAAEELGELLGATLLLWAAVDLRRWSRRERLRSSATVPLSEPERRREGR